MPQEGHWPFGGQDPVHGARHSNKLGHVEDEKAREAEIESHRRLERHDRFIIGGRAHARKRGLS